MKSRMNSTSPLIPETGDQTVCECRHRGPKFRLEPVGAERRRQQSPLSRMVTTIELHDRDAEDRLDLRRIAAGREFRVGQRLPDVLVTAENIRVRPGVEIKREFIAHDPDRMDTGRARIRVRRCLAAS